MPTNRRYVRRPHRTRPDGDQEMALWLGEGPLDDPQPFANPAARKAAWQRHRHRLIGTLPSSPGRRPLAWWQYDAPIRWPGYDAERSTMCRPGYSSAMTSVRLSKRNGAANLILPSGFPQVSAALHHAWADIPDELARRWTLAATKKKPRAGAPVPGQE